ncbi:hypothetical protein IW15_01925 [Chryseobacterium soli]|uniref:Uncharacterized protein n=2 Tax=Chryseobacterium soli TaxID=445961 RepID=A0A086AC12_9FLAO|nr:hypothetical protein IW15_01925 [Chryseobacterium soli]
MKNSLKKDYIIILIIFIIGMFFYDHLFLKEFKNSYKQNGLYTTGKIKEIKGYGRGTGCDYIYTFNLNGDKYKSVCDIGDLSYSDAKKNISKNYLVVYLSNDVHNNRLYSSIPINDSLNNDSKLRKWINNNSKIKSKIDSIPASGFFWENYF